MGYVTMVDLQSYGGAQPHSFDQPQTITIILGPPANVWATVAINRLTLLPASQEIHGKDIEVTMDGNSASVSTSKVSASVEAVTFGDISAYVLGYAYIDGKTRQELTQEFAIPLFLTPEGVPFLAPSQLYIPAATKVTFGLFVGGYVYAAATAMVFSFGDQVGMKHEPLKPLDACVVYDRSTGKVLHVHRVVCVGQQPTPAHGKVADDSLRYALQHVKCDNNQLDTLHVAELPHGRFKVNLQTKELVRYNRHRKKG